MKKLLLTLLLLLSLGFAASAATYTYEWTISSSDKAQTGKENITLSLGGVDWTGKNLTNGTTPFSQRNGSTSIIFGSKSNGFKELDLEATAPFVGKKIESVSVTAYNGSAAASAVTVYVNGTAIGDAQALTGSKAAYNFSSSEVLNEGNTLKIVIANSNTGNVSGNTLNLSGIKVVYADAETIEPEKITLEESNLVIKAGEQVIEGEEVELDANTTLTFSYNTDNANADIAYSYSLDAETYIDGNSYTFDGNDVTMLVKAVSANEVGRMLTITKKYPTECPTPEFSVANGAEVYAGQVITVKADGAESLHLTANDVDVDGTSYTVVGNPGDEITLYALASVTGKNGDITADATITVTVVEATEATFDFNNNDYGLTRFTSGSSYESNLTEISSGIATISFTGNFRLWGASDGDELRVMSGATFTISVPEDYYIESINFNGSTSKATPDKGTLNNTVWSYDGITSSVKFSCSGRVDIDQATVKYAKLVPTLALANVDITHGKAAGVVTINYTFEIANHNGNPVDVTAAINGMDHIVFEKVETPAAAPARAAGENAVISGTLKATHADLKGAPSLNINVKATLDGNDLYNENHTEYATTGIEDVTVEGGEAAEYFNLQGIRVAEPQAGQVYIVRRGAKTTKELVK